MTKVVHVVPYDGVGGVESAARSMGSVALSNIEFQVDFIFKNVVAGTGRWTTFNPAPIFTAAWRASRGDVDLVIVSLWRAAVVGVLAKVIRPRLKLVAFLHVSKDVHLLDFVFTRLAVWLAAEVWADSHATLTGRVPGIPQEKCRIISFVTRRFDAPSPRVVIPMFIFWGRVSQQKRLDRAIRFFGEICKRYPLAQFWVVGPDGGELEVTKRLCASLGLKDAVTFFEAATQEEIIGYSRCACFYLQTSAYEGMAMSVVESMQLGLVPVVTAVGEIANYCADGVNAVFIDSERKAIEDVLNLLHEGDSYQAMRANAIATWTGQPLYRDSVLSACQNLLSKKNWDARTVASFGDEWSRFDQQAMPDQEAKKVFEEYFAVFPWSELPANAEGFDMGCGSGRWARWVAPKVGQLHCIDPSDAIEVARSNLASYENVTLYRASVDAECLPLASQDFGYSLGVLHHVPDTAAAIRSCVDLLKPGAPLLLYLYYAFDNRSWWFRALWGCSDLGRRLICKMPPWLKHAVTNVIALLVYFPLATSSRILEKLGCDVTGIPLSYYRKHSFYTMRTDARDRFGTPLEHRFTRQQIKKLMEGAGLSNVRFSDAAPFWCAVGVKC